MNLNGLSLSTLLDNILSFLPRLALALAIYIATRLLSRGASRFIRRRLAERKLEDEAIILLDMLARWGILAAGIVLALEQLVPGRLSTLLAGVGVAGVTIGFALQDVAKNFIAGILLLLTRPFEIGDAIEVKSYSGKVIAINLRSTEIREFDGRFVIIPNADIFISPIVNFSRAHHRRVIMNLGVARDSDLSKAAQVALEAIRDVPGLIADPAPQLAFESIGDSAITGKLIFWVDTEAAGLLDAKHAAVEAILSAFAREGIEMPYPTQHILLSQNPA